MTRVAERSAVEVGSIVDNLPVGRFHFMVLAWCALLALTDGYDIAVIGFAGPSLVREWKITNLAALAPVFSAGLIGVLIGAPIFGYLGDRYGRKIALLSSAILYGLLSLTTMGAGSLNEMMVLRFLTGVAMGGVLPTTIALAAEYAPARFKLTFGMIVNLGIVVGAGLPGPFAAWLVPTHGWQVLFLIGGVVPIALALCLVPVLPESLKFLSLDLTRHERLRAIIARIRPDLAADRSLRFVVPVQAREMRISVRYLFSGGLAVVTPILWLMFMVSQMSTFFFQTWMPTLISSVGLPASQAALSYTWFQIGGFTAGVLLSRPIDKYGLPVLAALFALAVPVIVSLGIVVTSGTLLAMGMIAAGFCLIGLVCGLVSTAGAIYPTRVRSSGVGWNFAMGRVGGVAGPLVGGLLVGLHLPIQQLYYAAAAPLALGLIAILVLMRIYFARNGTFEIDEMVAAHPGRAAASGYLEASDGR